jgi:hypothetical protein
MDTPHEDHGQPFGPDYTLAAAPVHEMAGCRVEIWARRKLNDLEIVRAYLDFMRGKDVRALRDPCYRVRYAEPS